MRNGGRGFKKDQAPTGVAGNNPAPQGLVRQGQKVAFVIVTAERQLEPVLPRRRTVTSSSVAARFRENGLDIIPEVPLGGCGLGACPGA
jgi:hypothetical protein